MEVRRVLFRSHGFHDRGMLPHGEIIVGAPHCDRLWPIMSGKAARIGKGTLVAQYVNEHAVATLGVKSINRLRKNVLIVHGMLHHSSNLLDRKTVVKGKGVSRSGVQGGLL